MIDSHADKPHFLGALSGTLSHRSRLFLLFAMALLLRLMNLGGKSLWLDEAFSALNAPRPEVALPLTAIDPHPPLYYTLLHYWLPLAGDGEAMLRLPSALISLLSIGLLYMLARRLSNRRVALLAAALLAFAPLNVWYSQEARMHIFVPFFALLLALGLAWDRLRGTVVVAVALAVGLYMDYSMIPLWVGLTALWFIFWWQRGHQPVPFLAWLVGSLAGWLVYRPFWDHVVALLSGRLSGIFVFARVRELLGLPELTAIHFAIALFLIAVAIVIGGFLLLPLLRRRRTRFWLTLLAVAGFLLVTLLMVLPRFYTVKRVLVTGWPFVVLFVAWLVAQLQTRGRLVWRLLLVTSLVVTLWVVLLPKDDWRGAAAYIDQTAGDRAHVVWLDPRWNTIPYDYYRPQHPGQSGEGDDDLEVLAALADTNPEIWLIAERFPGMPVPSSPSEAWLDRNLELVEAVPFYRLEVRRYRVP